MGFTGVNSKSMHSHRRKIVFYCMCWPCVWQQICAISWDFFTPVRHNHQYILGRPPLRLTAKYPSETQEYIEVTHVIECVDTSTHTLVDFSGKSVKIRLIATWYLQTWCKLLKQLASSLWKKVLTINLHQACWQLAADLLSSSRSKRCERILMTWWQQGDKPIRPCHTVQFFLQLATQFYS